jgi:hypothetical protein
MNNRILSNWSHLNSFDKFNKVLSVTTFLHCDESQADLERRKDIIDVLDKIEGLRYELAYNRATECSTGHLDRVLAYMSLELAQKIFHGPRLKKYVDAVLYYEQEDVVKRLLIALSREK